MNIDFDINEVTSDILGMIWEKLVELDGETGPISGVTTLFLRSFHDVIYGDSLRSELRPVISLARNFRPMLLGIILIQISLHAS